MATEEFVVIFVRSPCSIGRLPYGGRVLLFRANKQIPNVIYDYKLGWGNVDIGELDIYDIESYHGNILFEPAVGQVAMVLNDNLV